MASGVWAGQPQAQLTVPALVVATKAGKSKQPPGC